MAIRFDEKRKIFFLNTKNTEYQIKINDIGMVLHTYYGASVDQADMSYMIKEIDRGFSGNPYECKNQRGISADTLPQEYSSDGAGDYRVSALSAVMANGSRTTDLRYKAHNIISGRENPTGLPYVRQENDKVDTLKLVMEDAISGLLVTLHYQVFADKDIISRYTEIKNASDAEIIINKAASMSMDFCGRNMDLIHFHGRHAMERIPERETVGHNIHRIASKRGTSSHQNNPFVILCDKNTDEWHGDSYGFMLMYSGEHAEEIEKDQAGSIRVVSGISDDHFSWKLSPGDVFETPEVILAYTNKGLSELSYLYHRIIRENVCPKEFRDIKRPVLINNWEGTYFDFDDKKIMEIAKSAADAGCEMFVLDDGWFGERNHDHAGLGDWVVNEKKLEGGMSKIADYVNSLGMKFGLWFEPEMVNEDSDLYRAHPDWALTDPDRKPVMGRDQLVLDMSRKDVVDYLYDSISTVLRSANISYVKWDFNRSCANVFSHDLPSDKQGEVLHRFMLGTYDLMQRLRDSFPHIMIEGCSGGGGRFDAGIMFYSPQIWCSDNTEAINRLIIQKGTSYGYPVSTMGSHVSASPNHQSGREVPFMTRALVAMSGTFGYELDPRKLSDADRSMIRKQIDTFNKYYELIQKGRYYRLSDEATESYFTSWGFVSEDKSEALVTLVVTDVRANPEIIYVKMRGLDESATYELDGILSSIETSPDDAFFESSNKIGNKYGGAALVNGGFAFDPMFGVYPAIQLHFKRV
ncbi:alpha-galactosidase [Butyrivibrio sp. NC2002]|uniref:alpha-galactosidase n=1 Tax=Butyrivibrio sp. NC2002 TaxID=1410610 RepID=UPI0005658249|nr:alpha-galactosidase [Butyrivibrio sp. NC2002]